MPPSNTTAVDGQKTNIIRTRDAGNVVATVTRPNDSTNYVADDQISNGSIITFTPTVAFAAGGGEIVSCVISQSTAPGTPPQLELWIFDSLPTFTFTDNIQFAPADADTDMCCGVFPVATADRFKGTLNMVHIYRGQPAVVNPLSGLALYGMLVVRNAYNPTALETFKIKLGMRAY